MKHFISFLVKKYYNVHNKKMIDTNAESSFLHQERSAMESYVKNFQQNPKELKQQKKIVKALIELVKIHTKIQTLADEKYSLTIYQELSSLVGLPIKVYKDKWVKKHQEFMKQCNLYKQKKKAYEKL